jgi:DME family drug/metabolite transporter
VPENESTTLSAQSAGRREAAGYLAVVAATACWGTSGVFVKLIVADTQASALALAFWRDLFTFAILFVSLGLIRPAWLRVSRRDLPWLIGMGAIGVGIFHVFWNLGVLLNGVAVTTVQQAAMPVVVAVAAWFLWREPLTGPKVLAIVLTFGGTVLISAPDLKAGAQLTLPGLLVGLGVPVAYATYSIFGKQAAGRYPPPTILTYGFGFATLALLPLQAFTTVPWPVPARGWLWFAGLLALSTMVPWSAYTFGLGRLPASVAGIMAMTEIPLAALYAYLLLGERLGPVQILGSVLVVAGVLLLSLRRQAQT